MKLEQFYANATRSASKEVALGEGWTSTEDPGATYSVYWIEATGEIFALRTGPVVTGPGVPKPYGVYLPWARTDGREDQEVTILGSRSQKAEVLGVATSTDPADRTLEWLRAQLGAGPAS